MKNIPIIESYWVEPDLFLAGEYPGSYNPPEMRQRMDAFLESGIRTFIDLTQSHELLSYESALKEQAAIFDYQVAFHRFAIRDHGIPSTETMQLILNTIDDAIQNGSPVYVHCWGGIGRTGTVVGCYLIRHGMTAEKALTKVNTLYKTRPHNHFMPTSPETDSQIEFVRNWREAPSAGHKTKQRFCEG